ncbi:MAG TPA: mercuric reductase [Chitinophaga sp.]|uniref:mercuric reductase n=1 Tax=Chitinophaga sp. TaxID=1869181 RepID=UPI002DB7847C|nr:mercuric reductase [Chitinophaga sp.]HEU4553387.1 mercuric reductase [Chitinophaga sp.]
MTHFKAVIIGSGQGGTPLAKKLAQAGWSTALVEKRFIGGTCINDGCTPTKAMVASAKAAYMATNSGQWGVAVNGYAVNLEQIVARKNDIVRQFRGGSEKGLENTEHLTLFHGEAVFTGPGALTIQLSSGETEAVTADYIFLDIGTTPQIPPVPGLDTVPWLTSTTILDLTTLPQHLVILGGSYIALEFGQMFRRFGSQVTIIEKGPHLVGREDEDVSLCVQQILEAEGLRIFTGAALQQVAQNGESIVCTVASGGQTYTVTGSHLLLAAGRVPQTKAIRLDKAGVQTNDRGFIKVNGRLETNVPGIYAMGDVTGGPAFTHISYNDHWVLYKNLVTGADATVTGRQVPYCMFTDPQLGHIGLTEKEAKAKGLDFTVCKMDMSHVARAIETGSTQGFMKALVEKGTYKILGATVLGAEGGELMTLLQMAMLGGITALQMKEMIFAHPLYAESLNNLFMQLDNQADCG